jgi:hypothetical protein
MKNLYRTELEKYIYLAKSVAPIRFIKKLGTYIYRNNRTLSEEKLLSISSSYIETGLSKNIAALTQRMLDGKLSLSEWQIRMGTSLKESHIINMLIGRGGRGAATLSDYGRVGNILRWDEYRHLQMFAEEIKAGSLSDAQILARVKMYANSTKKSYWIGRDGAMLDAGFTTERRILHPAEHCPDCIGYAEQGWMPIGTLPEPGEGSVCLSNCQCTKEYRRGLDGPNIPAG